MDADLVVAPPRADRRDAGSAVVLLVFVLAVVTVSLAVIVTTARVTRARAVAQGAADAVAVAATYDGAEAAGRIAAANHVAVVSLRENVDGYTVVVSRSRVRATARASRTQCPSSCPSIP